MSGYNGPGNPYGAPQQPGPYGQQPPYGQQQPYGQQPYGQQGAPFGGGPGPGYGAPQRPARLGLGVVAGVVAAFVAGAVYAFILGQTDTKIGYVAIGVGALVGAAVGKVGGKNPALVAVGAVLAFAAAFVGEYFGIMFRVTEETPYSFSQAMDLIPFSDYIDAWTGSGEGEGYEAKDYLFLALSVVAGGLVAKKVGDKS